MKARNLFDFGKLSNERRKDVSRYLIAASDRTMICTPVDFGVPQYGGLRNEVIQDYIFTKGWSKCDGIKKISFHQKTDEEGRGLALDLVPYIPEIGFSYEAAGRFGIIGSLMLESWEELQEEAVIPEGLFLHWGGLWSNQYNDPIRLGWDMAHFEIRTYEQISRLK